MKTRKYNNDSSLIRQDGEIALSSVSRAIADARQNATDGRLQRLFGPNSEFPSAYETAIFDPKLGMLDRAHLTSELQATRQIMKALRNSCDPVAQRMLNKFNEDPVDRSESFLLCPVWKHQKHVHEAAVALNRYVFEMVSNELYLVTIIFDFAENILVLEDQLETAHRTLKSAVAKMTNRRMGVMMTGCFEFDLTSRAEFLSKPEHSKMLHDIGYGVPNDGGWVLTGHFVCRVPHKQEFEKYLDALLPCKGWHRVRFDRMERGETLPGMLLATLDYAAKFPKPIFDIPTRGPDRKQADARISAMVNVFHSPSFKVDKNSNFDVDAATVQWAKMIERMGEKKVYFSVESTYAQRWYSQSEMAYFKENNIVFGDDDTHRVEALRDSGLHSRLSKSDALKAMTRKLRSRRLTHDPDWERLTDCSNINPDREYHDPERWLNSLIE